MKLFWYCLCFFTLFFILVNNPKSSTLGSLGDQSKAINSTREAQKNLQIITIVNVSFFFITTIFIVIFSSS
uniref:Probable protein-export membrane protein SecG n=1 Tax=Schizymenia dubyi TaxID=38368 RepID=A0A1C9C959_9FLOR|nr:preprotein translocase subunit G [Schizymenia dubyi]AOM64899.1 preprotein translocase subunit G [Schizymenia dubyi]